MIIDNLFNRKPIIVEGSAANDYFTRRKSEEERIAGTRAPVKNKKNPANTDYSKRRAQEKKVEQGVDERIGDLRKFAHKKNKFRSLDKLQNPLGEEGVAEGSVDQLSTQGADYSKYDTDHLKILLRPGILHRNEARFKALIRKELRKREQPGVAKDSLNELAPSSNPNGGNYLKTLASAWYNGTFNTGDLHRGIKSQEDVERILERGIHCGDGQVRKYSINYNADFDGVVIFSDDYYEYSTSRAGNDIDSRTGKKWGPYDFVAFHDSDLNEGVAEGAEDNDDIERLKAGNSTSDGIDMQDIRLMAGEGKLTKKTVLQALAVIRKKKINQSTARVNDELRKREQQGVAEAAGDVGTIPTTEFVKGIYSLAAEYGAEAPDPEQVKKMMVLAPNQEVDIQKTFQKIIATFQTQLPKITQMMSELDAIIKQADVQEGQSDLQEIQRTKGDEEGLSTKGQNWGKETLAKIKMLPGSQRFGYTAGDAGRAAAFLTDADTIIELFDVKHPQDGLRKAGFLSLRSAPWFPIKNSYQVANVALDNEYRGTGLGQNLYGIAMKLLGMTIVADDTQTPQARGSWLKLSQVPGVVINGYTSVFPEDWALRNNRNEIYDDSAKRLISSLLKAGGQEIGKNSGYVYVSFPVGANADQNELQALQKGMSIYSSRHPEDGGTQNGLYARWGGQVREQGVAEGNTLMKKLQQALLQEGRVKELADDLKTLNDAEFMKKYGKAKAEIRKDMRKVEEGSKRKKKKTSRSLGRYFFPGYGYYGSGESGGGSGDGGGGESINRGVTELYKIDESTLNEIDPGLITNLVAVFPTISKIIIGNALTKAASEKQETSEMIDVIIKKAKGEQVTPEESEAMKAQFKDLIGYGAAAVTGALAGGALAGLAGVYKKELWELIKSKGPEVLITLLKTKGNMDIVKILYYKFLGKYALPLYASPKQGVAEGLVKDIKRLATGKDVKSRAGQEIAKSQDASMRGDTKTSKKHFDRYDKLDKLANKEQGVAEGLNEAREGAMREIIRKELPGWPDYVIKDWISSRIKNEEDLKNLQGWLGEINKMVRPNSWQLHQRMFLTFDMLNPRSRYFMKTKRKFGDRNPFMVPRDKERLEDAIKLVQAKGIENLPPVIMLQHANGLELCEGWHRTMAAFRLQPEGFYINAWIGQAGQQGVAETETKTEKNPHTSALGKALYRDLSKQPKLSPQQVQRNKERWAQRQADRGQDVAEARMSAAQRLSNAWDKQRAKSDASLRRTPSSILKSTPEPKKLDTEPKTVSESRVKRRALMAQMLNGQ